MIDMKKLSFQIPISIVCLALAFALTWQLKGFPKIREVDNRLEILQNQLKDTRDKNESLTMQLMEYRDEVEKLRVEVSTNSGTSEVMAAQLARAEMLAGLSDVEGEGVVVTLTDRPASRQNDSEFTIDPNWGLIHNDMILRVINELHASCAKAINLNNERILSTTEVRCAGPTVTVNKTPYATPFVIRAIGPADTMDSALRMKGGVREYIEVFGAGISISKSTSVQVKRYTGAYGTQYAKPAVKEVVNQ